MSGNAVHVGCSGWNYDAWRGGLYPEGLPKRRWLERYAEVFDTVEVNSTFYRLASRPAVERWVEQTPPDFIFALKASRYLTHMKRLRDMAEGVERFYERVEPLRTAGKLGPVVWQLPSRFERDDERLAAALQQLPPGRHCFEFRRPSWFTGDVYVLLREHGAALVIGDHPERPFQTYELMADFTLVRFHYGTAGRRGNYSEAELDRWAERLRTCSQRVEVFANSTTTGRDSPPGTRGAWRVAWRWRSSGRLSRSSADAERQTGAVCRVCAGAIRKYGG